MGGAAPDCDDGNVCTDDSCNPATGCVNANNTAPCNDGDACTTSDTCSAGACVGGAAPNCDDGNVCTDDSCNPATGCVNANNSASCDDGDACTTTDTCSAGACVGGVAPDCDVVFYHIDGGGHTWPRPDDVGSAPYTGSMCRDFEAAEAIWAFFSQHRRNDGKSEGA